jgi:hypothetical protein
MTPEYKDIKHLPTRVSIAQSQSEPDWLSLAHNSIKRKLSTHLICQQIIIMPGACQSMQRQN